MRYALLIIFYCYASVLQAQGVPSMAEINVQLDDKQSLPLADEISFRVTTPNADEFVRLLVDWEGISFSNVDANSIDISMIERPIYVGGVYDRYLRSSFVIDIDEEVIKQLASDFIGQNGEQWKLNQLIHFVNNYIDIPTYIHGFNIASLVAKQRSGDCTEFAVLVTALARSLGVPSRVMVGTVLVESEEGVMAFGHAWSEVWANGQWQISDAALYDSTAIKHFYLPSGELDNEGPGFSMALFSLVTRIPLKLTRVRDF